jgi:hypothetical protein
MATFFVFILKNFNHEIHESHENFFFLVLVLSSSSKIKFEDEEDDDEDDSKNKKPADVGQRV